jgi:hypothetical protein
MMSNYNVKYLLVLFFLLLCGRLCGVCPLHADPIFEPIDDQTVCEGDRLSFSVFANADFSEDELDFYMEEIPEEATLTNVGRCGE